MTRRHRIALALVMSLDLTLAAILFYHRQDAAEWVRAISEFVALHSGRAAHG